MSGARGVGAAAESRFESITDYYANRRRAEAAQPGSYRPLGATALYLDASHWSAALDAATPALVLTPAGSPPEGTSVPLDDVDTRALAVRGLPAGTAYAVRFHLHPSVEITSTADGQGAILRIRGGSAWRFRCRGGRLAIDADNEPGSAEHFPVRRRSDPQTAQTDVLVAVRGNQRSTGLWT